MLLRIPYVLTPAELAQVSPLLREGKCVGGRVTAGHQSARIKDNAQRTEGSPVARQFSDLILTALGANHPDHPLDVMLTGAYHNLRRQWAER